MTRPPPPGGASGGAFSLPHTPLHAWQRECLKRWLNNGGRGIVNVATGAGKTVLALAAMRALMDDTRLNAPAPLRIRIVLPQVFMLAQWRRAILNELDLPRGSVGIYRSGVTPSSPITLYVINSACYTLARHVINDLKDGSPVLLICDECHHMGSPENARIFDFMPHAEGSGTPFFSLGLSATPDSAGYHSVLVPALGREVFRYGVEAALRDGILSRFVIANVGVGFSDAEADCYRALTADLNRHMSMLQGMVPLLRALNGRPFYDEITRLCGDANIKIAGSARAAISALYRRKELVYTAAARPDCACALIELLSGRNKILIFGERIAMTEALYARLQALYPGRVFRYHSGMGDEAKRAALDRYSDTDTGIMVSCKSFDEGLNIPDTDVGILLSSTGTARQRIQRIGRILRTYEGGGVKSIYYLYVADSSEESALMPFGRNKDIALLSLEYLGSGRGFYSDTYERTRECLLASLAERRDLSLEQWGELLRNLDMGSVRADYLLPEAECRERIEAARGVAERNYWIVMARMARETGEA